MIHFLGESELTYKSGVESHAYALGILETLDVTMQACFQFPSATVTDFGFLDKRLLAQAADASRVAKINLSKVESLRSNGEHLESHTQSQDQWTGDQLEILDVLSKLSNVKRQTIDLQTSIFRLGLDSISAVQITAHLRERGWKLSPIDILEVLCFTTRHEAILNKVLIEPYHWKASITPPIKNADTKGS